MKDNKESIKLPELQLLYLNLFVFGHEDETIFELLGVNKKTGKEIKRLLKKTLGDEFKTDNWHEIIMYSFECGLLKKYDHINELIKEQANIYTNLIFSDLFLTEISYFNPTETIKIKLEKFLADCDNLLKNKYIKNYFLKDPMSA